MTIRSKKRVFFFGFFFDFPFCAPVFAFFSSRISIAVRQFSLSVAPPPPFLLTSLILREIVAIFRVLPTGRIPKNRWPARSHNNFFPLVSIVRADSHIYLPPPCIWARDPPPGPLPRVFSPWSMKPPWFETNASKPLPPPPFSFIALRDLTLSGPD